jgi:hypothetical protein
MDKTYRRYEVLLPPRFNDGATVPDELIAETLLELRTQLGAVSWESQAIHGEWTFQAQSYRDDLVRVFVDVPDTEVNRQFFMSFKEHLKARFQQLDIWVTTHPLEIL